MSESTEQPAHQSSVLDADTTVAGGGATMAGDVRAGALAENADGALAFEGPVEHREDDRNGPPSVAVWLFRARQEPHQVHPDAIPQLLHDDENFLWVDISEYAETDLRYVADLVGIHHRGIKLALSSWQRPRVDVFGDQFLATVTLADLAVDELRVHAHELDLVVGNNVLVSAHKRPLPFADRLLARVRQDPDLVRLDSAFMLYIVLDQLLEHYETLQERIREDIELLQTRALQDNSDEFLQGLLRFKRYAFALSQLVEQHRNVFSAFLRPDFPYVSGAEVEEYFQLLEARLARVIVMLEAARQEVNSAFDIYISHQAHRTSAEMKILTMVATIALPANVILLFFSTQFKTIPIHSDLAFILMVVSIILTTAATLAYFRRHGWL